MVLPSFPERFQLLCRLGEGGMGVVFEAFDRDRNARVALKKLKSFRNVGAPALLRFKREFRALQDVHHDNLVSLLELIADGNEWFFTMELVEGSDLLTYVRPRAPMPADSLRALHTVDERPSTVGDDPDPPLRFERLAANVAQDVSVLDEGRLRAALPQLVSGLKALHAAGKVHRDIKPSNIRVTLAGRVVLLDFGLIADAEEAESLDGDLAGTPGYMAPEQIGATSVGPEADWYAVGVVLYEALTGRLPFEGTSIEILMQKQNTRPRPPRALAPNVPKDLDELCMRLLAIDPLERPDAAEIARYLHVRASAVSMLPPQQRGAPFVGRAPELEQLQDAFVDAGVSSVVVLVDGESGVGKSRLVKWFTDGIVHNHPEAVVLAGRCYEREQLPYKALDGVIDALAGYLASLPDDEATALLPRRVGPLVQVFPVLRRSRAFAFARAEATRDPHELRRRAFAILRQLLTRLASEHPLVIAIDDLQWADADSLLLLSDVLRPPDAPPLLLVATVRDDALIGEGSMTMSPVGMADVASKLPCPVRNIHLGRLPEADAEELAGLLLSTTAPDKLGYAATIAKEANGHPLFIDELARHAVLVRDRRIQPNDPDDTEIVVGPTFDLDAAVGARIGRLDKVARDALELVAVAGRPLPQEVVARAAGVDMGAFAAIVGRLRAAHLVHTSGARASDRIEVYHDRLRAAVLSRVAAGGRSACHKRLALALESLRSVDGEALSFHWAKAGEKARAAKFAAAAAHQATKALAFDRAAACWERALKLTPEKDVERQRKLRLRLAEALANAGRGALAAVIYARAADGAPPAQALELRRRAGEQYLRCGHFDEGIAAIRQVLAALDLTYPRSPRWALVQLVFLRLLLWVRGTRYRERDVSQLSARELLKVDVCWSAAFALGLSDHIYGAMFQSRAVLCALRTGEPTRVARALSISASYRASAGAKAWGPIERDLTRARKLAERMRDMQSVAYSIAASGMSHYLAGHFRQGLIDCDRAAATFRDRVPGAAWEQASMHFFALSALWYVGDLAELCRRQPRYVRQARERGDVYAAISVRVGYPNVVSLVRGDPAAARAELRDAMAGWSKEGFHLEHMWELVALTQADLYEGRGAEALARIEQRWAALRQSMLLRVQSVRAICLHARARAALAAASTHAQGSAEQRRLLAIAARDARGLAREQMAWTVPYATLARAAIASLRGDTDRAIRLLREAAAGFDAAEMALYATAARWRLAPLLERTTPGSSEALALRAGADAWMATQGVADPNAFIAMVAPGFSA